MQNSAIEWCDHTFNPWMGCTKVSDGCKHCYAEHMMDSRLGKVKWGPQGRRVRTATNYWQQPLTWNRKAEKTGQRARVFCASLADVFEDKPDQPAMKEWRGDLFFLIQATPDLDWLLLTKRPENVMKMIPLHWRLAGIPTNVWIGTSVENQEQADKRIPELLAIPAKVRFLSIEPLLGPVDFRLVPGFNKAGSAGAEMVKNFWVIVGGESGKGARPMHPDWVRSLCKQCVNAGVPFFFKQWGEWLPELQAVQGYDGLEPLLNKDKFSNKHLKKTERDIGMMAARSAHRIYTNGGFNYYRVGKKEAGRLLDGQEWNQFPEVHFQHDHV